MSSFRKRVSGRLTNEAADWDIFLILRLLFQLQQKLSAKKAEEEADALKLSVQQRMGGDVSNSSRVRAISVERAFEIAVHFSTVHRGDPALTCTCLTAECPIARGQPRARRSPGQQLRGASQ